VPRKWSAASFGVLKLDFSDQVHGGFRLKLHRVLGSHDPSLPFRPWLSQVASRQCIDELRRRAREQRHCVKEDEIAALPDVSTASPLAQVLRDEEQR